MSGETEGATMTTASVVVEPAVATTTTTTTTVPAADDDEYCYTFKVHSASNLPKVDIFGSIDPYVKLNIPGCRQTFMTRIAEKNTEPVWRQIFFALGTIGEIRGEVWDHNVVAREKLVGVFSIKKEDFPCIKKNFVVDLIRGNGATPHLGQPSEVSISAGRIISFNSLKKRIQAWPGITVDDATESVVVPITGTPLLLSVVYERHGSGRSVDLRLLETNKGFASGVIARFNFHPKPFKHVIRRQTDESAPIVEVGSQSIWAQSKLWNLPAWGPLTSLFVEWSLTDEVLNTTLADLTKARGWKGALNYEQAKAVLQGDDIVFDDAKSMIFLKNEWGCYQIDYDEFNADQSWFLSKEQLERDMIVDITHKASTKRTFKFFTTPITVAGMEVMQRASLDDLAYPVAHRNIRVKVLHLKERHPVPVLAIIPLL
ncbi:hypothetical protein Pelo_570 [Pelomyxa schiedti]|nr:hypothetical protein Pelo_570 [Pelomyxa schiedti]